jgi:hypothetical protein
MGKALSKLIEVEKENQDVEIKGLMQNDVQIEDIVLQSPPPVLDDDSLALIQRYRRIGEACQRREFILRHAMLEYAWSPGVQDSRRTFMDLIVRVPTSSAVPFHNNPPWEVFSFNGQDVRIGMWEDRSNLIYLFGDDVQTWDFVRQKSIGSKLFVEYDIRCKRIRYKKEWVTCG